MAGKSNVAATDNVTPIKEVANPAAVAWEWTDRRTSTMYQVVWSRGTNGLALGMKTLVMQAGNGGWITTQMDRGRWGVDGTLRDARAKAREFYEEGAKPHEM